MSFSPQAQAEQPAECGPLVKALLETHNRRAAADTTQKLARVREYWQNEQADSLCAVQRSEELVRVAGSGWAEQTHTVQKICDELVDIFQTQKTPDGYEQEIARHCGFARIPEYASYQEQKTQCLASLSTLENRVRSSRGWSSEQYYKKLHPTAAQCARHAPDTTTDCKDCRANQDQGNSPADSALRRVALALPAVDRLSNKPESKKSDSNSPADVSGTKSKLADDTTKPGEDTAKLKPKFDAATLKDLAALKNAIPKEIAQLQELQKAVTAKVEPPRPQSKPDQYKMRSLTQWSKDAALTLAEFDRGSNTSFRADLLADAEYLISDKLGTPLSWDYQAVRDNLEKEKARIRGILSVTPLEERQEAFRKAYLTDSRFSAYQLEQALVSGFMAQSGAGGNCSGQTKTELGLMSEIEEFKQSLGPNQKIGFQIHPQHVAPVIVTVRDGKRFVRDLTASTETEGVVQPIYDAAYLINDAMRTLGQPGTRPDDAFKLYDVDPELVELAKNSPNTQAPQPRSEVKTAPPISPKKIAANNRKLDRDATQEPKKTQSNDATPPTFKTNDLIRFPAPVAWPQAAPPDQPPLRATMAATALKKRNARELFKQSDSVSEKKQDDASDVTGEGLANNETKKDALKRMDLSGKFGQSGSAKASGKKDDSKADSDEGAPETKTKQEDTKNQELVDSTKKNDRAKGAGKKPDANAKEGDGIPLKSATQDQAQAGEYQYTGDVERTRDLQKLAARTGSSQQQQVKKQTDALVDGDAFDLAPEAGKQAVVPLPATFVDSGITVTSNNCYYRTVRGPNGQSAAAHTCSRYFAETSPAVATEADATLSAPYSIATTYRSSEPAVTSIKFKNKNDQIAFEDLKTGKEKVAFLKNLSHSDVAQKLKEFSSAPILDLLQHPEKWADPAAVKRLDQALTDNQEFAFAMQTALSDSSRLAQETLAITRMEMAALDPLVQVPGSLDAYKLHLKLAQETAILLREHPREFLKLESKLPPKQQATYRRWLTMGASPQGMGRTEYTSPGTPLRPGVNQISDLKKEMLIASSGELQKRIASNAYAEGSEVGKFVKSGKSLQEYLSQLDSNKLSDFYEAQQFNLMADTHSAMRWPILNGEIKVEPLPHKGEKAVKETPVSKLPRIEDSRPSEPVQEPKEEKLGAARNTRLEVEQDPSPKTPLISRGLAQQFALVGSWGGTSEYRDGKWVKPSPNDYKTLRKALLTPSVLTEMLRVVKATGNTSSIYSLLSYQYQEDMAPEPGEWAALHPTGRLITRPYARLFEAYMNLDKAPSQYAEMKLRQVNSGEIRLAAEKQRALLRGESPEAITMPTGNLTDQDIHDAIAYLNRGRPKSLQVDRTFFEMTVSEYGRYIAKALKQKSR